MESNVILFLGSQRKTEFFRAISNSTELDCRALFLHPSHWSREMFGEPDDLVLSGLINTFNKRFISCLPNRVIKEVIAKDRILRGLPPDVATSYLLSVEQYFLTLVRSEEIGLVVGEFTWGHELLIGEICAWLGIRSFYLDEVKCPPGRLCLFDIYKREMQAVLSISDEAYLVPEARAKGPQHYLDALMPRGTPIFSAINKLIIHLDRLRSGKDYTVRPLWFLLLNFVGNVLAKSLKHLVRSDGRSSVVIFLHKKPDSQIDTTPPPFRNQRLFIKRLVLCLRQRNPDVSVCLKLHPHDTSLSNLLYYMWISWRFRCSFNPGRGGGIEMYSGSTIVSIAGTASLEALWGGGKGICFAPTYYSKFFRCQVTRSQFIKSPVGNPCSEHLLREWDQLAISNSIGGRILGINSESVGFRGFSDSGARLLQSALE